MSEENKLCFRFTKSERLSKKKAITSLFSEGKGILVYPFRAIVKREEEEETKVSILISVAKKRFKHAVDRNRIKRLCREAYRLNKSILWEVMRERNYSLHIAFVYIGGKIESFAFIQEQMIALLTQIKAMQE